MSKTAHLKIINRQIKEKELLLQNLKKIPIVEVACSKSGIGRATYYRWRKEDAEFSRNADESLNEGIKLINDMAESQLLSAIKDGNISAIFYWLNHRHTAYGNRVEITTNDKLKENPLSDEQKKAIETALGIINKEGGDNNEPQA